MKMSEVVERYVRRYPNTRGRFVLSVIIAVTTAILAIVMSFISIYVAYAFIISLGATYLTFFSLRFLSFKRISGYLLAERKYSKKPSFFDKMSKFSQGLMMLMLMLIPFLLIPFLPPDIWIGFLFGLFCGSNTGESCFYILVRAWENKHKLRIFAYWLWDLTFPSSPELLEIGFFVRPSKK